MGTNFTDTGVGGVEHAGLWPVIQGRVISRPAIQVGDVGPDAPYGTDPWGLPPQVCLSSDGETSVETS